MSWSLSNPGEGNVDAIRELGARRTRWASSIESRATGGLDTAIAEVTPAVWEGQARERFSGEAAMLHPEIPRLVESLRRDAQTLDNYATQLSEIQDEVASIRSSWASRDEERAISERRLCAATERCELSQSEAEAEEAAQDARVLRSLIREAEIDLIRIDSRLAEVAESRRAIDGACVAALTGVAMSGSFWRAGKASANNIDKLSALSPLELRALLRDQPDILDKMWKHQPDPQRVAGWWNTLSEQERAAYVAAAPLLIGNLDGVRLADRASANKLNLTAGIELLERELPRISSRIASGVYTDKDKLDAMLAQIAYYKELRDGEVKYFDPVLDRYVTQTGHTVLAFDHGRDVIAEYSGVLDKTTGNIPDHIKNLGLYIPGTNTTLGNFADETGKSERLAADAYSPGTVGLITWKGGPFPQWLEAVDGTMADRLGERLANFGGGLNGTHQATTTAIGYSFGGSIVGGAEENGLGVDRVLHVSSAGSGHGVDSITDYPNTSEVPHYSMLAPDDFIVGGIQGVEVGGWGHGASPLNLDGFTRLETGYPEAGNPSSGQIQGHFDVWNAGGTAIDQIGQVLQGGQVEIYTPPEYLYSVPKTGQPVMSNPIMERGYEPTMIEVQGGLR